MGTARITWFCILGKGMAHLRAELSVRDMPEVIAEIFAALAAVLRSEADAEVSGYTAARLREIADAFECGQSPEASCQN